jgi:hypothetical protein
MPKVVFPESLHKLTSHYCSLSALEIIFKNIFEVRFPLCSSHNSNKTLLFALFIHGFKLIFFVYPDPMGSEENQFTPPL